MKRNLPPLTQLRTFEAAARLGSFKAAAEELNVTHTAVSHQIKALEDYLGFALFARVTRGVRATPEALDLCQSIGTALDQMGHAVDRISADRTQRPLRLSVPPFFGNRLLLPNISGFHAQHPDIRIEIDLDFGFVDFASGETDAAIRYGKGDWPELSVDKLYDDLICPVCAPPLVEGKTLPLPPEEIVGLPLSTTKATKNDWAYWFEVVGYQPDPTPQYIRFDNRALALDYALVGNGVTLADLRMVQTELAKGTLVRLHPQSVAWNRGMYVVAPPDRTDARLSVFVNWLRSIEPEVG